MIISSEIKWRKPNEISQLTTNGGVMTFNEIVPGVLKNVFPSVGEEERLAGSITFRKLFYQIDNAADLSYLWPQIFAHNPTLADDRITFHDGSQIDIEGDLTGSEQLYGTGYLNTNLSIGNTVVSVNVEDATDTIFVAGMIVRISDMVDSVDFANNEEFIEIDSVAAPVGNTVEITLLTGVENAYSNADTHVASVLVVTSNEIKTLSSSYVVTSVGGTYDNVVSPVNLFNKGTIHQSITVTFTSPTAFDVSGDTIGSVGSGNITTDFVHVNPDTGVNMFFIPLTAWGGAFLSGDTLTFDIDPAAYALWLKRTIPAGAADLSNNTLLLAIRGESDSA